VTVKWAGLPLWTALTFLVGLFVLVRKVEIVGRPYHRTVPPSRRNYRLIAVADLHGDFRSAMQCLQMAQVVDRGGKWIAGNARVVQLGDVVDRGSDSIRLMKALLKLQKDAYAAGGRLEMLIGNHELLYLAGDFTYASENEMRTLGKGNLTLGQNLYRKLFAAEGALGKTFLERPVAVVMGQGRCRSLFVHGGFQAPFLQNSSSLDIVNQKVSDFLHSGLITELLSNSSQSFDFEKSLLAREGPIRYRGYAMLSRREICPELDNLLAILSVERMIVGHTVQKKGPRVRCNGRLILIDTGVSRNVNGMQVVWECSGGESRFLSNADSSKS